MTISKRETPDADDARPDPRTGSKRRYEKPRLVDHGLVSKLTQTGGITTRDTGTRKRVCL